MESRSTEPSAARCLSDVTFLQGTIFDLYWLLFDMQRTRPFLEGFQKSRQIFSILSALYWAKTTAGSKPLWLHTKEVS